VESRKKGRKVALLVGLALVVVSVALAWANWEEIRFFLKFERIDKNDQGHPEYRHRQTGIVFVRLPGGTFEMGASKEEAENIIREFRVRRDLLEREQPRHAVTLSPFLISKYEVTRAEWQKVMGEKSSNRITGDDFPVTGVSWEDCQSFCQKAGLALPTEAQWEYACRTGTTTLYHSGDTEEDLARVAWYSGNGGDSTHPVGEKKPNDFGLHDMHGNIAEWCEDVFDEKFFSTPGAQKKNPVCTSGSEDRVVRGGCWASPDLECRSAWRDRSDPSDRHSIVGFRPAWSW